jgi:molecular chaperone Hsp33
LGVRVDKDYSCLAAGGVLIQLLPFPDDDTVDKLERNASGLSNVSSYFERGMSNEEIANIALEGIEYDIFDSLEVEYKCDCTSERMLKKIKSLGENEIMSMLSDQEAEGKPRELTAECRFCNSKYTFSESELLS